MPSIADASRNRSRLGLKQIAIGGLLVGLGAVAAVAMVRETRQPVASVAQAGGAYTGHPERPAFTAEEEAYALALWPIHEQIKTTAVRMTFAGLSYKMGDIDRTGIKRQVAPLTKVFQDAGARTRQLTVPPSMAKQHTRYLNALRMYENASLEMVKAAQDGKDDHLVTAQKLSFAASEDLLRVGDALWPGEFKPN